MAACDASRCLFHFGEERLETLTPRVFISGQPGLEQTQNTKSVVHTQRCITPRAFVRLMCDHWEHITEAIEYHWKLNRKSAGLMDLSGLLRIGRERTAKVADFILNVGRILYCLGHFIAQQPAVALPHAIK